MPHPSEFIAEARANSKPVDMEAAKAWAETTLDHQRRFANVLDEEANLARAFLALQAQLAEKEAERVAEWNRRRDEGAAWEAKYAAARANAEAAEARAKGLEEYVQHKTTCNHNYWKPCDCGLSAAQEKGNGKA